MLEFIISSNSFIISAFSHRNKMRSASVYQSGRLAGENHSSHGHYNLQMDLDRRPRSVKWVSSSPDRLLYGDGYQADVVVLTWSQAVMGSKDTTQYSQNLEWATASNIVLHCKILIEHLTTFSSKELRKPLRFKFQTEILIKTFIALRVLREPHDKSGAACYVSFT